MCANSVHQLHKMACDLFYQKKYSLSEKSHTWVNSHLSSYSTLAKTFIKNNSHDKLSEIDLYPSNLYHNLLLTLTINPNDLIKIDFVFLFCRLLIIKLHVHH